MEWDEVERRVNDQDRRQTCILHKEVLDRIELHMQNHDRKLETQDNKFDTFSTFMAQAKVVGVIALIIWCGSFIYTYNHKVESNNMLILHRELIDSNSNSLSDVRGDYKAILVEIRSLTKEVSKSTEQNTRLIDALTNR